MDIETKACRYLSRLEVWKGGSTPPSSCKLSSDSNSRPKMEISLDLIPYLTMPRLGTFIFDSKFIDSTISCGLIIFSKTALPYSVGILWHPSESESEFSDATESHPILLKL